MGLLCQALGNAYLLLTLGWGPSLSSHIWYARGLVLLRYRRRCFFRKSKYIKTAVWVGQSRCAYAHAQNLRQKMRGVGTAMPVIGRGDSATACLRRCFFYVAHKSVERVLSGQSSRREASLVHHTSAMVLNMIRLRASEILALTLMVLMSSGLLLAEVLVAVR